MNISPEYQKILDMYQNINAGSLLGNDDKKSELVGTNFPTGKPNLPNSKPPPFDPNVKSKLENEIEKGSQVTGSVIGSFWGPAGSMAGGQIGKDIGGKIGGIVSRKHGLLSLLKPPDMSGMQLPGMGGNKPSISGIGASTPTSTTPPVAAGDLLSDGYGGTLSSGVASTVPSATSTAGSGMFSGMMDSMGSMFAK